MPDDKFSGFALTLETPATTIVPIVPDDIQDLSDVSKGLNVATPGTVRVTTLDGAISDVSIAPGQVFPLRATRIWATGTTATGIRILI